MNAIAPGVTDTPQLEVDAADAGVALERDARSATPPTSRWAGSARPEEIVGGGGTAERLRAARDDRADRAGQRRHRPASGPERYKPSRKASGRDRAARHATPTVSSARSTGMRSPRYAGLTTFARLPQAARTSRTTTSRWSASRSTPASATGPAPGSGRRTSGRRRDCCGPTTPRWTRSRSAMRRSSTPGTSSPTPSTSTPRSTRSPRGCGELIGRRGRPVLSLGGDHTIALPAAAGDARRCTGRSRWCTSTPTSTPGTPTSTRRTRTARRSGGRREQGLIVQGHSAHVGIRGSLYDRQDLLDDAGSASPIVHCRDIDRLGVDGVRRRDPRTGRRPPGVRLDRHRRARPGVRPGDRHARGRRDDQPRTARGAARR